MCARNSGGIADIGLNIAGKYALPRLDYRVFGSET